MGRLDPREQLAASRGDADLVRRCGEEAERLRERVEEHAWDGEWYLRAFFDDGTDFSP